MNIQCLNGDIHCVYIHSKKDGSIFYVGAGLPSRPFNCYARSDCWKKAASETGFMVTILEDYISEDEAYELEEFLISEIRDSGIKIINKTNGGKGCNGFKQSKEQKEFRSKMMKGRKRSAKHCEAISNGKKGKPNIKNRKPIRCLETGEEFESLASAAKAKGVCQSSISQHLTGRRSCSGGLHYEYILGVNNV